MSLYSSIVLNCFNLVKYDCFLLTVDVSVWWSFTSLTQSEVSGACYMFAKSQVKTKMSGTINRHRSSIFGTSLISFSSISYLIFPTHPHPEIRRCRIGFFHVI
eukprot:GHVN01028085.1.p1 GENE.GHVN01028085.1~~GHVN01028085.1.p1  ORF type:complete len:103 (-),score=8.95 GHVN01028085.1:762-1070(-)